MSAHVKGMEDALGLTLFERTARGMTLTHDGERLLAKAEETLAAHRALLAEAARGKGELGGTLRLGASSNSSHEAVGRLVTVLAQRCPGAEVVIRYRSSQEVLAGVRNGSLDAGFYNEPGRPEQDLTTVEVSRFAVVLVAAKGFELSTDELDWKQIADRPWIYGTEGACCRQTAEAIFQSHGFRPKRVIGADRQEVVRTLVASGLGVGLLHADSADDALRRGELVLLYRPEARISVRFAYLEARANDPLLSAASGILQEGAST